MRSRIFAVALVLGTPLLADVTVRYTGDFKLGFTGAQGADGILAAVSGPSEIRVKGNKSYQTQGKFITITDLATNEITYIDPEGKRFGTAPADEFVKIISKAVPQPPNMPNMADMIKTEVQSRKTGRTETIQGIPAEEAEIVLNLTFNIPNAPGGAGAGGPGVRLVMQEWRATQEENSPALAELARYRNLPGSSIDAGSMIRQFSGPLQGFAQSFGPIFEQLGKDKRLVLRVHMEATSPIMAVLAAQAPAAGADPNAPLFTANREIAELSTGTVDESVFRVPEGYRKVDLAEILKDQMGAITQRTR